MPKPPSKPGLKWRDDNQVYVIRWYDHGRKREFSTRTADHYEAQKIFLDWQAQRLSREQRGHSTPRISDTLTRYLVDREGVVADLPRLAYAADPLFSWWGSQLATEVRGSTCRAYLQHRRKQGVADGTIRRELGLLRAALNLDHKEGFLPHPVAVTLPPAPEPKDRYLTREEAAQLIRAAKKNAPHLVTFIRIGLETGQRAEAILSLSWMPNRDGGHVDLASGIINFNPIDRAKTKKRRAIVPISKPLLRHLKFVRQTTRQFVIEHHGQPIKRVKRAFKTACHHARLQNVTPHTLRHTAITWACRRGEEPFNITSYFQLTMEVLQRVYLHHHPDYLRGMVDRRRNRNDQARLD